MGVAGVGSTGFRVQRPHGRFDRKDIQRGIAPPAGRVAEGEGLNNLIVSESTTPEMERKRRDKTMVVLEYVLVTTFIYLTSFFTTSG